MRQIKASEVKPGMDVPERIEEWPDDDTALRSYPWRDVDGDIWRCVNGWWRLSERVWESYRKPLGAPWERETDA